MDNTLLQTGSFVSLGDEVTINLRGGVTNISLINKTAIDNNLANAGYKFEWQVGMGDTGIVYFSGGGGATVDIAETAAGSFVLVDTANSIDGNAVTTTAGSNAVRPIISTANTDGLSAGSVVRYYGTVATPNLNGYEFSVDTIVANTSFRVANALANIPGAVAAGGFYRIIPYSPMFYPARRSIVNITQADGAVITTSVTSAYQVGQSIRLVIPPEFGMVEANGLLVNITAIGASGTFTTDLDTRAFTAFTFPAPGAYPFTQAQCIPVGAETDAQANPNLLVDATENQAIIGLKLSAGILLPAGQTGDEIFYQAYRSYNG